MAQTAQLGFKDPEGKISPPLPIQQQAFDLRLRYRHVLKVGSFGTGKSEWLCQNILRDAIQFPGNLILTGRKKLDWFKSSTLPILLDSIPVGVMLKHDKVNHVITVKTTGKPSVIMYRQLDSSREALKQINSMNLGLFAPDQAEEIDEEVFNAAIGRLRRPKSARQSVLAANPAGHNWLWQRWVNKRGGYEYGYIEGRMWQKDVPPPTCQAEVTLAVSDNPFLPWDYIASLLNDYPEHWKDRYIYCGWDNFEGLVYPMWDSNVHLVKPHNIPSWYNRYIAMDHGHRHPTAVGWWFTDEDGNAVLYDLHYQAGKWVEYHSEVIKSKSRLNRTKLEEVKAWIADPSIFHEQRETMLSDEYEEYGIEWEPANNDINGGINRVASYLEIDPKLKTPKHPEGQPRLFVFDKPETRPFVDEIGNYQWEDLSVRSYSTKRQEKPKKRDDDCMDMMRYMINWLKDSVKPEKKKKDPYPYLFQKQGRRSSYMGV